jgi:hypothetical protein
VRYISAGHLGLPSVLVKSAWCSAASAAAQWTKAWAAGGGAISGTRCVENAQRRQAMIDDVEDAKDLLG